MTTTITKTEIIHTVDRSKWQPGPWHNEPEDRIEWRDEATGLPCLMVRNSRGSWCGYVGVAPDHPWHGVSGWGWYADDGETYVNSPVELQCHGGVTYSAPCQEGGAVCHIPQPGEPDAVWWFGFDCSHAWDASPIDGERYYSHESVVYRFADYVRRNVTGMAQQLAAVATPAKEG